MKPTYQVTIQAVENGFVVRVGCRLFVSENWEKVAEQLNAYFTGQETEFIKQAISSGDISGKGIFTKKCLSFFEDR